MCAVFAVTRAGFYAWLSRPESPRALRARELTEQIRLVHHESRRIYGGIKITRQFGHRHLKANQWALVTKTTLHGDSLPDVAATAGIELPRHRYRKGPSAL